MRFIPLTLAALLLAACQATGEVKIAGAFDPQEAAFIKKEGDAIIDGHAFFKKPNGYVMNASGEVVRLIPATAYAKERFDKLYGGRKFVAAHLYPKAETTDPRYAEYMRTTKAESTGRFRFEKVAPGTYYLSTQITWKDDEKFLLQGGAIWETVTITGKEEKIVKIVVNGF